MPLDEATIIRILQAAKAEQAAGRIPESDQLLANVAQRAPHHPAVLNELGVRMLARGVPDQAQMLFSRAAGANPNQPAIWANLASSLKALGRRMEELDAIEKALALEPRHLSALLQKGQYFEDMGDPRNAARAFQAALDSLPLGAQIPLHLKDAFDHAKKQVDADRAVLRRRSNSRSHRFASSMAASRSHASRCVSNISWGSGAPITRNRLGCTSRNFPPSGFSTGHVSLARFARVRPPPTSERNCCGYWLPIAKDCSRISISRRDFRSISSRN